MAPTNLSTSPRYTCTSAERRPSLRFRSNLKVSCRLSGKQEHEVTATTADQAPNESRGKGTDISTHGIGLVCNEQLDPGTVLECNFLNPTTRFACSRPVQVMRVVPQA